MKRLVMILLSACTLLVVAACGSNAGTAASSQQTTVQAATTKEVSSQDKVQGKHILVAYFSRTGDNYAVGNIAKGNTHIVADMIADKMFQKQSLINEFKGQDFLEDFKFIFDNFPKNVVNPITESGLAFDTFMKEGISKNYEAMKRNMKISNLIKDNIELGKIKEFGC